MAGNSYGQPIQTSALWSIWSPALSLLSPIPKASQLVRYLPHHDTLQHSFNKCGFPLERVVRTRSGAYQKYGDLRGNLFDQRAACRAKTLRHLSRTISANLSNVYMN